MGELIKGKIYHHLGVRNYEKFHDKILGCDFLENDGGRSKYFKGKGAGDCVTRAITIASGLDYLEIYNKITDATKEWRLNSRSKNAMKANPKNDTARTGVFKDVYHKFILDLGFKWKPLMKIGSGCKVHLRQDEVPNGTLILSLSRHLTCTIDKVINDTYDPSRGGMRCIYGYYEKEVL